MTLKVVDTWFRDLGFHPSGSDEQRWVVGKVNDDGTLEEPNVLANVFAHGPLDTFLPKPPFYERPPFPPSASPHSLSPHLHT